MHPFEALRALARLAADGDADRLHALTEATRITGSAIGSDDVRLFAGDGTNFQAYPSADDEDAFGMTSEATMMRSTEARRLGAPLVYNVGPNGQPCGFAAADGTSGGEYLVSALWCGEALAGSAVAAGPWTPAEALQGGQFLESAGPALAVLLERVIDADRGKRIETQMSALSSVARVFADAKSMEDALQDVANAVASATGFLCSVDVLDAKGRMTMRSAGVNRYAGTPLHQLWVNMTQAPDHVKELILEHREPVVLPDLQHDPRISEEAREFYAKASLVSGATFPLLLHREVLGLLRVGSLKPTSFPAATIELLEELAVQAAMVVNAVQLHEERERVQEAMRASEQRFRSLVQNASDLITVIEPDTTIAYQSPSVERVLGFNSRELTGTKLSRLLHPDDVSRILTFLSETMSTPGTVGAVEARLRHRDGSWRHVEIKGTDRRQDAAVAGFIINTRDVTERKALEQQLRFQAFHDPLTRLANRARFTDRLQHALTRSARSGEELAVLFMDLDDFKSVNDSLGHSTGDQLLVEIGQRVQACLRDGDTCARLGGDEFAILLEDVDGVGSAAQVAGRITEALAEPFCRGGTEVTISASLGIATSSPGPTNADDLLRRADVAMYAAKNRGKAHFEVYEQEMHVSVAERLELLGGLQQAIDQRQFVAHYQPIVSLRTGRVLGMEALARWEHPQRGILLPEQFIPLAEESGAILPIGAWMLSEACGKAKAWQSQFPGHPPLALNVNVSMRQLQQQAFAADVHDALDHAGMEPNSLVVEITENAMMQNIGSTADSLHALKNLGVRLAIDDFGTGYSSLGYLGKLPLDILKIDKSFVAHAHDQEQLIRAFIQLGESLRLQVVAEGIETDEQLERLRALKCEAGQGFLLERPLQSAEVDGYLRRSMAA